MGFRSTMFPSSPLNFLLAILKFGLKSAWILFCLFIFLFRAEWQNVLRCSRAGRYFKTAFFAALYASQIVMEIET
jgi:hypothetical protein